MIVPPLPYVGGLSRNGTGLVVMCPLSNNRYIERKIEWDERKICQVDLMNMTEDLLPLSSIRCFQFLPVEGRQGRIAIIGILIAWDY